MIYFLLAVGAFSLGFGVAWRIRAHDAVRFRRIACQLVAEAAKHKGGKISIHVARQAAFDLGLLS